MGSELDYFWDLSNKQLPLTQADFDRLSKVESARDSSGRMWFTAGLSNFTQHANVSLEVIYAEGGNTARLNKDGVSWYPSREDALDALKRTVTAYFYAIGRRSDALVVVRNLAYSTGWGSLRDHFGPCGDIARAEVPEGPNKQRSGLGLVLFKDARAAADAVRRLDGTILHGSKLLLELYNRDSTPADSSSATFASNWVANKGSFYLNMLTGTKRSNPGL